MPEIEHTIVTIPIDEKLGGEVEKLRAEGWEAVPGVTPVAIYHLVRVKKDQPGLPSARGIMRIDDTQVEVMRNGKPVSH